MTTQDNNLPDEVINETFSCMSLLDEKKLSCVSRIWDLPDEVFTNIFSYLSLRDKQRVRVVCSRWNTICDSYSSTKDEVISVEMHCKLEKFNKSRKNFQLRIKNWEGPVKEIEFWKNYGSRVKELQLQNVMPRPTDIFLRCINYCKHLQSLTLSGITSYNDDKLYGTPDNFIGIGLEMVLNNTNNIGWGDFAKHLPTFNPNQYLTFLPLPKLPDVDVMQLLGQSSSIQVKLDFASSPYLDDDFLVSALKIIGAQVTGLNVSCCHLTESPIILATLASNLKEINLNDVQLTTEGFSTIFQSLQKLTTVIVRYSRIDHDVLGLILDLKDLTSLDLTGSVRFSPEEITEAFSKRFRPNIHDLRLNHASQINDDVIATISGNLPNLNHLEINYCSLITASSLRYLSNNCKFLRVLSLRECTGINDSNVAVSHFFNRFKGLQHLDLQGCVNIGFKTISELQLLELLTIDFGDATPLETMDIHQFTKFCPSIHTLNKKPLAFKNQDI